MSGSTYRERIAQRANNRCAVPGCYHLVRDFSRYCSHHDKWNRRTGHPEGSTITIGQLKPYRKMAECFLVDHLDHPGVTKAKDFLVRFLSGVTPARYTGRRMQPWDRLKYWRHALWISGVDPLDIVAVVTGMCLLQDYESRSFKSDRHFWHQMTIRILKLSKPRRTSGSGHTYHPKRITVGERDLFTNILKESQLLTLGHRVAQEIINREEEKTPPRIEGVHEPFSTSQTKTEA